MQLLLTESYDSLEDNDNNNLEDDSYSIDSYSTLSSNDSFLNDDQCLQNDQILGEIFSQDQRCMIKLIKLLEDMNCPDSAVEKLLIGLRNHTMQVLMLNLPLRLVMAIYNG